MLLDLWQFIIDFDALSTVTIFAGFDNPYVLTPSFGGQIFELPLKIRQFLLGLDVKSQRQIASVWNALLLIVGLHVVEKILFICKRRVLRQLVVNLQLIWLVYLISCLQRFELLRSQYKILSQSYNFISNLVFDETWKMKPFGYVLNLGCFRCIFLCWQFFHKISNNPL